MTDVNGSFAPKPSTILGTTKKEFIMDTLQMIINDAQVKIDFTSGKFQTLEEA